MAEIKERLVKTDEPARNDERICDGLFAATAAKVADGVIRLIGSDSGNKWCE